MGNLVKFTLPRNPLPLTKEQKEELDRAKRMPFVYDEDCPPQTDEELKRFRRVNASGNDTTPALLNSR